MTEAILLADDIAQVYQRLIAARNQPINANDSIKQDIAASRAFQEKFCCSDPAYLQQIAAVKASKPDNITSGTVGAYLYGCFQPELAVEIGCTPDCANGLRNPDVAACDISSYEKRDGKLTKLNNTNSEDANIFLARGEKITHADREQLKQDGVKVITIYNQDGESINYVLGESINLYEPEPVPPPETTTTTGWWWILVILAIVIVIGLVFFLAR